jgi:hypothetical protein
MTPVTSSRDTVDWTANADTANMDTNSNLTEVISYEEANIDRNGSVGYSERRVECV